MVAGIIDQVVEDCAISGDRNIDVKQWRANVVDLKRVMGIAKSAFLLLEHSNEACLRVAVEIVTDKVGKKTLWWNDNWVTDGDKYEYFKKIVNGKVNTVMTSLKGMAVSDLEEPPDKDEAQKVNVSDLQKRLAEAEAASKAYLMQSKTAELQCRDAQTELEEAQTRIANLEKSLDQMREVVRSSEAEANELKKKQGEKPPEAAPKPPPASQPMSSPEDKKRIGELEKQVKDAQDQKKAAEEAKKKAEEALKAAKAEAEAAKKDKEKAISDAAKEKAASKKEGKKADSMPEGNDSKVLGNGSDDKATQKRIAELEGQLQKDEEERSKMQKSHLEAKQMLEQAEAQAQAAQAAAQKLEDEKKQLQEEKAQWQRDHDKLQQDHNHLHEEHKKCPKDLAKKSNEKSATSSASAADLAAPEGAVAAKLDTALRDLEDQRRMTHELKQARDAQQAEFDSMKENASAAEEEARAARSKLEKMKVRMKDLEDMLAAAGHAPSQVEEAPAAQEEDSKKGARKRQDGELEELRAQAEMVPKLQEKLAKKREENQALREEIDELQELNNKLSRTLAQVRDQLQRVSEIAEKRGCGQLIKEIMEEAEVTKTIESKEFGCFARLYEDAIRRQKKARTLAGGGHSDSEEEGGGSRFLKRGKAGMVVCPSCSTQFTKDGTIHRAGHGNAEAHQASALHRSGTSPTPSRTAAASREESRSPRHQHDDLSRPTSAMRRSGQGGYKAGYDEGYRAGVEAVAEAGKAMDSGSPPPDPRGRDPTPSMWDPSNKREGGINVTGHSLLVPPSQARTGSKSSLHSVVSAVRDSRPSIVHHGFRDGHEGGRRTSVSSTSGLPGLDGIGAKGQLTSTPNLHQHASVDPAGDSGAGSKTESWGGSRWHPESGSPSGSPRLRERQGERLHGGQAFDSAVSSRQGTAQGRPGTGLDSNGMSGSNGGLSRQSTAPGRPGIGSLDNPTSAALGRQGSRPGTGIHSTGGSRLSTAQSRLGQGMDDNDVCGPPEAMQDSDRSQRAHGGGQAQQPKEVCDKSTQTDEKSQGSGFVAQHSQLDQRLSSQSSGGGGASAPPELSGGQQLRKGFSSNDGPGQHGLGQDQHNSLGFDYGGGTSYHDPQGRITGQQGQHSLQGREGSNPDGEIDSRRGLQQGHLSAHGLDNAEVSRQDQYSGQRFGSGAGSRQGQAIGHVDDGSGGLRQGQRSSHSFDGDGGPQQSGSGAGSRQGQAIGHVDDGSGGLRQGQRSSHSFDGDGGPQQSFPSHSNGGGPLSGHSSHVGGGPQQGSADHDGLGGMRQSQFGSDAASWQSQFGQDGGGFRQSQFGSDGGRAEQRQFVSEGGGVSRQSQFGHDGGGGSWKSQLGHGSDFESRQSHIGQDGSGGSRQSQHGYDGGGGPQQSHFGHDGVGGPQQSHLSHHGGGGRRQSNYGSGLDSNGDTNHGHPPGQGSDGSDGQAWQGSYQASVADNPSLQDQRFGQGASAHNEGGHRTRYDGRCGSSPQHAPDGQQGSRHGHGSDRHREEGHSGMGKKKPSVRPMDPRQKVDHGGLEWRSGNHTPLLDDGLCVLGSSLFGESSHDDADNAGGEHFRSGFRDGFVQGFRNQDARSRGNYSQARGTSPATASRPEGSLSRPTSRLALGTPPGSTYEGLDSSDGARPRSQGGASCMVISGITNGDGSGYADRPLSQSSSASQQQPKGRRLQNVMSAPRELPQLNVVSKGLSKTAKNQLLTPINSGAKDQESRPHWRRRKSQDTPFASDASKGGLGFAGGIGGQGARGAVT